MTILIQDEYTNTSETTYNTLEEFKVWFNGLRDDFHAIVETLNIEGWNAGYVTSVTDVKSESFDADTQMYIRVTEWADLETYEAYRACIASMNWETGDLFNLQNQNLGLEKVTIIPSPS